MSISDELNEMIGIIDNGLKDALLGEHSFQKRIFESIDYSLFSGGKRLRPIMLLKTFEMYNSDISNALPFALAIEMIHTYSLVHDDLPSMDDDDFRRGKPTSHKVFGEAMAILTGDGLLNLAFETMTNHIVTKCTSLSDYKMSTNAMSEISKYSGVYGMIGGQVVDLLGSHDNMTEDRLLFMYRMKTAALIQSSIVAGAILGGADEADIQILREFGLKLGLAYQIRDDLLDSREDNIIDKFTYLKYYNMNTAKAEIKSLSDGALNLLAELNYRDTRFLRDLTIDLIEREI